MHEFSITQNILSIALEKAREAKASKITMITITIGELSGIVDESVQFYFDFLRRDTIAAEAALSFNRTPFQARCRTCGRVFSPDGAAWACPACQSQQIEITSGRECYVESIEVD